MLPSISALTSTRRRQAARKMYCITSLPRICANILLSCLLIILPNNSIAYEFLCQESLLPGRSMYLLPSATPARCNAARTISDHLSFLPRQIIFPVLFGNCAAYPVITGWLATLFHVITGHGWQLCHLLPQPVGNASKQLAI